MSHRSTCLASFLFTMGLYTSYTRLKIRSRSPSNHPLVHSGIFVLGGPGAGKRTLCARLAASANLDKTKVHHLSVDELLRSAREKGGQVGHIINNCILSDHNVPSSVIMELLKEVIIDACSDGECSGVKRVFLMDGFPRYMENISVWDGEIATRRLDVHVRCIVFLECPEELCTARLLGQGATSGHLDNDFETIRKRFRSFREEIYPVMSLFESGIRNDGVVVKKVLADRPMDMVYQDFLNVLQNFL
uniref:Adenylate kinase n=1 Tax=Corethron hystrix TaxID=216773 RepID=A0A7S1BLD7_9STRA|mmetsp:Transcript_3276/g.6047  ORF Transcript_3276/g.6047 Transcript_3276/m.6047 type:complete len:247 (+) Transcript_3276:141-881(+)